MKSKFARRRLVAVLAFVALLAAILVYSNRGAIRNAFDALSGADYSGGGSGSVVLEIKAGDDGAIVAQELVDLDVV